MLVCLVAPTDSPWSRSSLTYGKKLLAQSKRKEYRSPSQIAPASGENRRSQRALPAETTVMNGSFGGATNGSIVLQAIVEKKDPSHAAIHCLSLVLSNFITSWLENGRKWRFWRVRPAETRRKDTLFGCTLSGSIVLDAMVEKKKPLLDTVHWFSQPQTNFTTLAKFPRFPCFFDIQEAKGGGRRDLWKSLPAVRFYLEQCQRRRDLQMQLFTVPIFWYQTSPLYWSKMGENGVFPLQRQLKRRGRMARWEVLLLDGWYFIQW